VSEWHRQLEGYLALRRAMGFKLERHAKLLGQFVDYLAVQHVATLTVEHALAWASAPHSADVRWWAARLSMVRGFAGYLHALDPAHQIPPPGLLPQRARRAVPYLYADREISALITAAGELALPLRAATYQTLVGLLAATGMRVGEAIRLDREDFDAQAGVLTVRGAKFGKSRQLPLHATTTARLGDYLELRDRLCSRPSTTALLLSARGYRLRYERLWETFHRLVGQAGLQPRSPGCVPRIHDLRHTFAVTTLLGWYRDGADVPALLPRLSTYLGHADPKHTYWYLSAAPELHALAADRLDSHDRHDRHDGANRPVRREEPR
jgi:integrase/recombinase XerD